MVEPPLPLPRSGDSASSDDESWCSDYVEEPAAGQGGSSQGPPGGARSHAMAMTAWSIDSLPAFVSTGTGRQQIVANSLSGLKQTVKQLCVIVTKADDSTPALRSLKFIVVKSSTQYSLDFWKTHPNPPRSKATLIIQVGLKVEEQALQCTDALSRNAHSPAIIVVVIPLPAEDAEDEDEEEVDASGMPSVEEGSGGRAENETEGNGGSEDGGNRTGNAEAGHGLASCRKKMRKLQDKYIESGADDFIILEEGEELSDHRVLEAIHRAEMRAKTLLKLNEQVYEAQQQAATQVQSAKDTLCRKMQITWKDLMWNLPGKLLEGIPPEDKSLEEHPPRSATERGGVGDYRFTAMLRVDHDAGLTAMLFLAEHPQQGEVAMKVIQKSAVKTVANLFSLDQEIRILKNLPPHPHVARTHEVLHSERNIFVVLDYCGGVHLHRFVQRAITHTGEDALAPELSESFCVQMSKAIAHLHGLLICHRDIKPTNFLVSDDGETIRLAEFNLVMILCSRQQLVTQCCGSLPFCAPEVLKQERGGTGYDPFAADIWSLAGNFAELALGPYSMERLLGWVPTAETDVERRQRDLEGLPELWAGTPDPGIPGLSDIVKKMWVLQPSQRWRITDVIGPQGFGLEVADASKTRATIKMGARENLAANGVEVRPVDWEFYWPKAKDAVLLDRLGGAPALRKAIDKAFDEALASTPLGMVLEGRPASIPAIRSLYLDKVVRYFSAGPGTSEALSAWEEMKAAHQNWVFSDADFDALAEQLEAALIRMDVRGDTAREAVTCFGHLRDAITDGFQVGADHARKRNTAEWRQTIAPVAEKDEARRLAAFAGRLADILESHTDLQAGLPSQLQKMEGIEEELRKYFGSKEELVSPLPLVDSSLSMDQLALFVELARCALVEAHWPPEDALTIYFSLREEWARAHLSRKLAELSAGTQGVGQLNWMSFALRLQQALQTQPATVQICEHSAFLWGLSKICQSLRQGSCEEPRQQLSVEGGVLGLHHAHLDALLEATTSVCSDFPSDAAPLLLSALRAMRPWLVRSGR